MLSAASSNAHRELEVVL